MSTDHFKPSDALRLLYNELSHIRRIHFALIVLSCLTILITLTAETNTLFVEIETLHENAAKFYTDRGLHQLFRDKIKLIVKTPPRFTFLQECIPKEKLVRFLPKPVTDIENRNLSLIRKDFEEGVTVEGIEQIDIDPRELTGCIEWISRMEKGGYEIGYSTANVEEWPTEKLPGKIKFTVRAGSLYQERSFPPRNLDRPPTFRWITREEYPGVATFKYKTLPPLRMSALWFSHEFPYLYSKWATYANRTLGNALIEAKQMLAEPFVSITLPLGVQIRKEYSLLILPSIILLSFILFMIEIQHVASYVRFCKREWQSLKPIFLSPWIGSRNWWPRWLILSVTVLIVPSLATWLLFQEFPIFGYWTSRILAAMCIFLYGILLYINRRSFSDIAQVSFPQS